MVTTPRPLTDDDIKACSGGNTALAAMSSAISCCVRPRAPGRHFLTRKKTPHHEYAG
jgi:hypothetical protein